MGERDLMKKFFSMFLDEIFLKFIIIGASNMLLLMAIMFTLYNWFGLGYWGSSIIAFTLCSIISYILNRKISFKSNSSLPLSIMKFIIVIAFSYFIAFLSALPIMRYFLALLNINSGQIIAEQLAMVLAQGIFTIINFIGQRLWAFK